MLSKLFRGLSYKDGAGILDKVAWDSVLYNTVRWPGSERMQFATIGNVSSSKNSSYPDCSFVSLLEPIPNKAAHSITTYQPLS